jgi:hypothetical protein
MKPKKSTNKRLPPALPFDNTYPPLSGFYTVGVKEDAMPVFEERQRAVVGHFRRSNKIQLRGQVKLDV